MAYPLLTIEEANRQLEDCRKQSADRQERISKHETDMDDCFVSDWGNGTMIRHAQFCIEAQQRGLDNGFNVPCGTFLRLTKEGRTIPAKLISTQYGMTWLVTDEETERELGRKFIPTGDNSKIQKRLGLREEYQVMPCKPYVIADCGGMCQPVNFRLAPL